MSGAQRHSGAPLLNQAGEVIGLALAPKDTPRVFQASDNGGDEGMVAVKIHYAKALLNLLPESEYVAPPPARSISTPESAKPALVYIEARR
jgi:hypothetical protein